MKVRIVNYFLIWLTQYLFLQHIYVYYYVLDFFGFFSLLILPSGNAYGYIGPGMGGGVIAATLGIIIAIFAALFGILYYPLKRYIKNKKNKKSKL